MVQIRLDWFRSADGYRIEEFKWYGQAIVSNGRKWLPSNPLADNEMLYAEFSGVRRPDQLLAFINRYGLLNQWETRTKVAMDLEMRPLDRYFEGELVEDHLESAALVREALRAENNGGASRSPSYRALVEKFEQEDLGSFRLVPKPKRSGFQLEFQASTLLNGIWLQLARRLGGEIKWGECKKCGAWFEKGPGTNKRADSEFCSPAHKVAFHRLQGRS